MSQIWHFYFKIRYSVKNGASNCFYKIPNSSQYEYFVVSLLLSELASLLFFLFTIFWHRPDGKFINEGWTGCLKKWKRKDLKCETKHLELMCVFVLHMSGSCFNWHKCVQINWLKIIDKSTVKIMVSCNCGIKTVEKQQHLSILLQSVWVERRRRKPHNGCVTSKTQLIGCDAWMWVYSNRLLERILKNNI